MCTGRQRSACTERCRSLRGAIDYCAVIIVTKKHIDYDLHQTKKNDKENDVHILVYHMLRCFYSCLKSCALPFAVSALSFFFSFSYDNSFVCFACIIAYYCNTLHTPLRRVTHIYIVTYTSFSAFFFFLFLSSFFFLPHTVPLHLSGFDF